jgi:tetratricopeptide (TPR) repeat protein
MRLEALIDAYQALKQPDKMLAAGKDLLGLNPKNLKALYWIALLTVPSQTSPDALDLAQKAANGLLGAEKPTQVTDDQWKQTQAQMAIIGHRTLGWIAYQRKDYPTAETEFKTELQANPNDSQAVYWLAGTLGAQAPKKPELLAQALFYYARAAAYDGPGALDPAMRQRTQGYVQTNYTKYHGDDPAGFQALLASAKANVVPPEGFKILSEDDVKAQKLQALQQASPSLALWVTIKEQLTSDGGDAYFSGSMKDALVPPEGQPAFQGKVISQEPALHPKSVKVAIEDGKTPDATLVFDPPLPRPADPGTAITFRGVPTSFTKQPFVVSFDVDKKNLTGWPAPPPPKKAPVHKKKAD